MKLRIFPPKSIKLIIITIFLLLFISMSAYAVLWGNKVDTQDLQRIITELCIYDDPDFPYYNEIFRLYYHDSKELLNALNNKIEINQQTIKILDTDIKKDELGNLTYGRYLLNAINEKELVEMGIKTGSPAQANGEYFSKLGENLADWKSQLNKVLITKIIGATCIAMGGPVLSIGISTLGLFCDLSIIGISISKLNEAWYEKAFWSYMQFRNDHNFDHVSAWGSYAEPYVNHIFILSPEKQKKARKAIEENFESLWDKYGDHIVSNKLDEDFKSQQRESLKIFLLYALGAEPNPIITSPLKITPDSPYQVGDIINAEFTIANRGTLPIKFGVLTVGGRDNDNQVADFSHRQNIILRPIESYDYKGTLTLNKVGDHHFFCTYQTPDGEWNTNIDVGSKLTDEDREEDIYVEEKIVNQPPDPPANLAQFESDGEVKISIGGKTDGHNIILKGKVKDLNGDKARLEVEIRRLDEYGGQFDEDAGGLKQSDLFENNSEIMIPIYGLADGDYHWRTRAIDEHGLASKWVSFGGNPDSAVDFTVGQEVVAPIITSPLKIIPDPPYYVGDTINTEFSITNKNVTSITFTVLTVGGRDSDNHVSDFTHRQNITLEPSESYNYQGTLTLNKVGDHHFFCTYQTPDGEWNTDVDLNSGLTDEDRIEDIVVKEKGDPSIAPDISEKLYIEWDKTFGGSENDLAWSIIQTSDGGYSVTGYTRSKGKGERDFWIIKLDHQGNILWDKTFGGSENDWAESIIQTKDGGYMVAGTGTTLSKNIGELDAWIIKLDEKGNIEWDKTFGGSENDWAYSIIQTSDGGYAVAGYTSSKGAGESDAWVIKLDAIGNIEWDKTFGGSENDEAVSIIQTSDGGYAIAGSTKSKGAGKNDAWIIKLDHQGNKIWDKIYGGEEHDYANSLIQTSDGGYVIAGGNNSKGRRVDAWVIKLDDRGNLEWDKIFGGDKYEWITSLIQTSDGDYAIAGATESKGAGKNDAWIIKLDHQGNKIWDKIYGGEEHEYAGSLIQTSDGGYAIAGSTESKGAGKADIWVIKLNSKSIETLEEEVTAMEALEDKIEKEKLLIDSSLYHIECNKPIVSGNIFVVIPVNVSGPADELALILANPEGETNIRFISKRALIDNFETVKLHMGNAPLSEGPYILTVKTVTPEKIIYKKELWFTLPDVSIADAEFTYKITHLGGAYGYAGYYFLEMTSLTLINNGDLPAKRDTNERALITLDGKPENMTLLTRRYSISPYKIDFYPPTYIPNGKNKVPIRAGAMYGLKKGNYFVTITIPLIGGETVSLKKALTIE